MIGFHLMLENTNAKEKMVRTVTFVTLAVIQ